MNHFLTYLPCSPAQGYRKTWSQVIVRLIIALCFLEHSIIPELVIMLCSAPSYEHETQYLEYGICS